MSINYDGPMANNNIVYPLKSVRLCACVHCTTVPVYPRKEMVSSVHSEARGRDGGLKDVKAPPSIYQQAASLNRREVEISQVCNQ